MTEKSERWEFVLGIRDDLRTPTLGS